MINIYEPYLNEQNLKYAHDALNSTWISSHGKYLDQIKEDLLELNNFNA
jgi:dTDP-4-amino-4,6-dideoxygalactose transaminase